MKAAGARFPLTEMVESDTIACEPASWTENPSPRCPVIVTVTPLSFIKPPERALAPEAGSESALDVALEVIELVVKETVSHCVIPATCWRRFHSLTAASTASRCGRGGRTIVHIR